MVGQVCVDASFILSLLLPESFTPQARDLWQTWTDDLADVVAPPLFFAEVTSVLRLKVHLNQITAQEGEDAFSAFISFGIRSMGLPDLQPRAWALAKAYSRPRTYDAQYLAVADALGCDLWTADRRLINAVHAPWLRWLGDHKASV